ncbi:MAG: hypothetical protein WD059_03295 [Balneolaceae bacterium]
MIHWERNCRQVLLYTFTAFITVLLFSTTAFAQNDYEKWKKEQEAEFKEYRDKFDREFVELLENTWEEVGIKEGSPFYKEKKPIEIPTAPTPPVVKNPSPEDSPPVNEPVNIPEIIDAPPVKIDLPAEKSLFEGLSTNKTTINYFSSSIPFEFPLKLREFFSPNEFITSKTDNKKIADFWEKVSSIDHSPLIEYSQKIRSDLNLNDWGYILLLNDFTNTIFKGYDRKLTSLYNWFLLTKAGYKVRIGYDQQGIYNLFSLEYRVFNTKYFTLDGDQYYIIDMNRHRQTPGSIFTYKGAHQAQSKKLNLRVTQQPNLGDSRSVENKTLSFTFNGTDFKIPLSLDKNLVIYFEYFPLTELPVFFTASLSGNSKTAIHKALAPAIAEMNEEEAVNLILRFVQTSFEYKTDQDQFNREKYMLPEETLFYQYSDCDDRSILFANLVQELLELEVVGLRYSKHLATAVLFNEEVEGDAHYHSGKKFIVADPTYINANVGMTMTQYKNEKPEIVSF